MPHKLFKMIKDSHNKICVIIRKYTCFSLENIAELPYYKAADKYAIL